LSPIATLPPFPAKKNGDVFRVNRVVLFPLAAIGLEDGSGLTVLFERPLADVVVKPKGARRGALNCFKEASVAILLLRMSKLLT